MRQSGLQSSVSGAWSAATDQWIEPDQAAAAALEPRDFAAELLRIAAVPAVGDRSTTGPPFTTRRAQR